MSDVTDAPPRAATNEDRRATQGSHIWYELMTPTRRAREAFYDAVVRAGTSASALPATRITG